MKKNKQTKVMCLDIGNTNIYGGVFSDETIQLQFRYPSSYVFTSDQLGVFFKQVLQENQQNPKDIKAVSIASVVPSLNYSVRSAFIKYFDIEPKFIDAKIKTDLIIACDSPLEVGADRIANAIAVLDLFPKKNIIIVDLGTATTFEAISHKKEYLGGAIIPGIYTSMKALHENTAQLPPVNITQPSTVVGKNTVTNIQSGLYFSHLGAIREITKKIAEEVFHNKNVVILGTGGFSYLFTNEHVFSKTIPDLVLHGLRLITQT